MINYMLMFHKRTNDSFTNPHRIAVSFKSESTIKTFIKEMANRLYPTYDMKEVKEGACGYTITTNNADVSIVIYVIDLEGIYSLS